MVERTDTPADEIVDESVERGLLGDGAEIQALAVEAGPAKKRKGLGFGAWLALGWIAFIVVLAIGQKLKLLGLGTPTESFAECARKGPLSKDGGAGGFLLGCDGNGRDMIPRLALGSFTSMYIAVGAIGIGFLIGGTLGLMAGFFGNDRQRGLTALLTAILFGAFAALAGVSADAFVPLWFLVGAAGGGLLGWFVGSVDTILTGMFNMLLSVPAIVMALALVAFLQGSAEQAAEKKDFLAQNPEIVLIIAIGVVSIPLIGRIARASAISWSQREFVLAARAQGAKNGRIMVRELLPNVAPAMFSISLLGIAVAVVAEGTLSILGVGVPSDDKPSWGNIIALDRTNLAGAPHIIFEASIMIFLTVLALNFLGDVVRSRLDVRESGI